MFKRPCIWQDSFEDKDRSTLQLQAVQHPTLLPAMHSTSVSHSSLVVERRQGRHFWVYCALFLMPLCLAQALFTETGRAGLCSAHFHHPSFPPHTGQLLSDSQHVNLWGETFTASPGCRDRVALSREVGTGDERGCEGTAPFSLTCNALFWGGCYRRFLFKKLRLKKT